jgi:hypothetical protein
MFMKLELLFMADHKPGVLTTTITVMGYIKFLPLGGTLEQDITN